VESKLREDPMMDYLRAEQTARHNILKNPVKMKDIRKAALLEKLKKATKKMKKDKKKKDKKKDKKKNPESGSDNETQGAAGESAGDRVKISDAMVQKYGLIIHNSKSNAVRTVPARSRSKSPVASSEKKYTSRARSRSNSPVARNHKKPEINRNSKVKQNYNSNNSRKRSKPLTEEEKAKKLAEMMADGEKHDKDEFENLLKARKKAKQEEDEYKKRTGKEESADFIRKMNKEVYSSNLETMEDRLKKYQHYRQKGNIDRHDFA